MSARLTTANVAAAKTARLEYCANRQARRLVLRFSSRPWMLLLVLIWSPQVILIAVTFGARISPLRPRMPDREYFRRSVRYLSSPHRTTCFVQGINRAGVDSPAPDLTYPSARPQVLGRFGHEAQKTARGAAAADAVVQGVGQLGDLEAVSSPLTPQGVSMIPRRRGFPPRGG